MNIDWNAELIDQLDWHWEHQLRPRLAELVLHINREVLRHGAEIALLRDLYRGHEGAA